MFSTVVNQTADASMNDFLTFLLDTPVFLSANSVYGFDIAMVIPPLLTEVKGGRLSSECDWAFPSIESCDPESA